VSAHGYKVGDHVRVVASRCAGGPRVGHVYLVTETDDSALPVEINHRDGWWAPLEDLVLVDLSAAPALTGEMLAMSHGKAWQFRAAKQTGLSAATMRTYADLLDGAAVTP
jgi:hypothetical protein